jgi:hypothetical protein
MGKAWDDLKPRSSSSTRQSRPARGVWAASEPGQQQQHDQKRRSYHIVRFDPSKPEAINLKELNALKYTMGEGEN